MEIKDIKIVKKEYLQQATSITNVGVFLASSNTKSQEHYVQKYLIKELKEIVDEHQELSWTLLMASIEFVGRYISSDSDSMTNRFKNRDYFRAGLAELGDKYQKHNSDKDPHDLYKFRNNVAHLTFFLPPFSISELEKNGGSPHLAIINGNLNLVAEELYDDIKAVLEKAKPGGQKFNIKSFKVKMEFPEDPILR